MSINLFNYFNESKEIINIFANDENNIDNIKAIIESSVQALKSNKKLMFAGNGGSAADSQHIAGELVSRFNFDRPGLPAMALTTDTSIITAIGNDYGYENLFSRQIQALGEEGDLFFGISTSGNSPNIVKAFEEAKRKGITTVGFTGLNKGEMNDLCDHLIIAPSFKTPKIQEIHIMVGHIICACIEEQIFGDQELNKAV